MIVKAMEDKDRSDGGRKFWFWSEFRSVKHTKGLDGQKRFVHRHCFEHLIIWVESLPMKPVVCFGAVTLLRQDVHIQSQGQGNSLVFSCLVVIFFSKLYLEIFDGFHKCADGISAHRASARMWSQLPKPKTLLLCATPQPTLPPDCASPRRIS